MGSAARPHDLVIVIPVYNEDRSAVEHTVDSLLRALESAGVRDYAVVVVDDGSRASEGLSQLGSRRYVHYIRHEINRGYGAAIKTGILQVPARFVGICDADGTYPVASFPSLIENAENFDMVVGTRTGRIRRIPWLRRLPKLLLNSFASYFAGARILDLNSGMRVFRRELALFLWPLIPNGFSLTSTLTMGTILGGFRMREVPIDYYARQGVSAIRPIRDTVRFFRLVVRLGIVFAPKRLFSPIAVVLAAVGAAKGLLRDIPLEGHLGNLSVLLILSGLQIYLMGILGHLVTLSRGLNSIHLQEWGVRNAITSESRGLPEPHRTASSASRPPREKHADVAVGLTTRSSAAS